MSRMPPLPGRRALQSLRNVRTQRLLTLKAVRESLISVAGLVSRPVKNQAGDEIGRVSDVVVRWGDDDEYPPVTGLVVAIGRRDAWVPAEQIRELSHTAAELSSARLDLRDFGRREGEVTLIRDVIDHQLVDVDGVKVVRAADLYIAPVQGTYRLVGVDVSAQTLLRRLGPARWRTLPTPDRVIDWAAIQPFGTPTGPAGEVRLRAPHQGLRRLRPGEVADLLEELSHQARRELLSVLEPEAAADALEEMEPRELSALLQEAPPEEAAELVARMEPDEAVEALRELEQEDRDELLEHMPAEAADHLSALLDYDDDTAGGLMTTNLVLVRPDEAVEDVRSRLRELEGHRDDIDAVIVVDGDGRLVDDVTLFELFVAAPQTRMAELAGPPAPVTILAGAPAAEVAQRLIDNRGSSLLVVDGDQRPLGRILADDVVDALMPGRIRVLFPAHTE
ncbi:MAG TPA: CBS domain-containing protein [Actinomycetota bacterium]|nr:CBS domain-containing protein [Actinomycetota bacterium]